MAFFLPDLPPISEASSIKELIRQLSVWRDALTRASGATLVATVSPSGTTLDHGLRAKPRGWVVTRLQGTTPASLVEVSSDDKHLKLVSSATVTVTLWVY